MKSYPTDLRKVFNSSCKTNCNRKERKELTDDDMCKVVSSAIDGYPLRCVGSWAFQKVFVLNQYFNIFANGMKKKWKGLNYIEICSGPGRCITRDGEEFDGTALSIINNGAFESISSATFIDLNEEIVDILNMRITNLGKSKIAKAVVGDYSSCENIKNIVSNLPQNNLNLLFIDPTDCSVPFNTIKTLKGILKKVDLIINFAIGTDLKRNILPSIYQDNYKKVKEKYAKFLGTEFFFEKDEIKANIINPSLATSIFYKEYENNLRSLGYQYITPYSVKGYYYLVFVTEHPRGLDFWDKALKTQYDGQQTLF